MLPEVFAIDVYTWFFSSHYPALSIAILVAFWNIGFCGGLGNLFNDFSMVHLTLSSYGDTEE